MEVSEDALREGASVRLLGYAADSKLDGSIGELIRRADGDDGSWVVLTRRGLKIVPPQNLRAGRAADVPMALKLCLGLAVNSTMVLIAMAPLTGELPAMSIVVPAIPVSAVVWLFVTLLLCFWLSRPVQDPNVCLPAISEMGVADPARTVYRIGFLMVGLLLGCTMRLYDVLLMRNLQADAGLMQEMRVRSLFFGYMTAAGVVIQGVFTLGARVTPQTILHFLGAALFIVGSMFHTQAANTILTSAATPTLLLASPPARTIARLRRLACDHGPVSLIFFPLAQQAGSLMLSRADDTGERSDAEGDPIGSSRFFSVVALVQWAVVLMYAFIFCSYAVDFWIVATGRGGTVAA